MSERHRNEDFAHDQPMTDDQRLESFLDGTMNEQDRAEFIEAQKGRPEFDIHMEHQTRIDESLRRMFSFADASNEHVAEVTRKLAQRPLAEVRRSTISMPIAILAFAASVAFVGISIWWYFGFGADRPVDPFFQPTQLVSLYDDAVRRGFKPYYECKDDDRFAEVFANRQGVPLVLEDLPEGIRMLGLSYPGGLSRETTAMLCIVDGEQAMVFVDRLSADQPEFAQVGPAREKIFIHRTVKHDLVFYEVSHFDTSRIVKHMVPAKR